jgi:hypothetical protein
MEKWQVALCKWAETGWPTSDWCGHLGWWPISARQGRALGHGGAGGGPAGFWRRPAMRCSGEGPGSKAVGWWTRFGAAGRKKLTGRMSSIVRCGAGRLYAASGVEVDSSRCGEVVHSGTVLGAW